MQVKRVTDDGNSHDRDGTGQYFLEPTGKFQNLRRLNGRQQVSGLSNAKRAQNKHKKNRRAQA